MTTPEDRPFVPEGLKWAHLDIAGPSWNAREPHGYTPKGGTGVTVRAVRGLHPLRKPASPRRARP